MSINPKLQKKEDPKKVDEKPPKRNFAAFVSDITPTNAMQYILQNDKTGKRKTMSLAYVDVPRFDREKKAEECFAYETGEYLRKKLLTGKLIKFETIQEHQEEVKAVVPYVGKENIIVSLLEKGYVVLRQSVKAPEIYVRAEQRAKTNKNGVHNENALELCKKRPEKPFVSEQEAQNLVGKTINGFIKKIEAPAIYHIEMENRKTVIINLTGVNQMLRRDKKTFRWIYDEDGEAAMEHCRKYFYKRDVAVEVKEPRNGKLYGVIRQDKKDIAEDLLKNGFVVCAQLNKLPESLKQPYEKAEKEAKKEQRARWTNFDQALEDRLIAAKIEREQKLENRKKNCNVISGAEVKRIGKNFIEIVKDGERHIINFASVRFLTKKEEKQNELVIFRIRECIRKQIVGKKFECKEAYREKFGEGEKAKENIFYDVYAGGRNICLNLFKEGLVFLNKQNDEFKRSFDYDRFEEAMKQNNKYKEVAVRMIEKEEKIKNKDVYKNTAPNCVLEKIISPVKFLVYLPEKDVRMRVALRGCRVPRDDQNKELQQFLKTGKDFIRENVGLNEITVSFTEFEKGEFLCDIVCKKFNFAEQLVENGYVMFVGKEAPSENVEMMRENGEKIWKYNVRKPREEEKEPRPVIVRPKREFMKEIKFDDGNKIYIVGYDGSDVYYYENAAEASFVEELSNKMKGIKRGKVEEKEGAKCIVDVKGKFYRATIVAPVPSAFVVKCIDTGAVVVCGKNKLKPMTEEIEKFEAPKQLRQITMVGLKTPVRGKHEEYEMSIKAVAAFYNKEATLFQCTFGEKAFGKIVVEDVCLNKKLVEEGLAVLNKSFKDQGEWGREMFAAQENAKENHFNMWKYGEYFDDEEKA